MADTSANHDSQSTLLSINNVCLILGGQTILNDVSMQLCDNEIVTLIGPNGSGKSSLVRIALGLLQPSKGEVKLRHGMKIGYMPQHLHVENLMPLTVRRFLQLGDRKNDSRLRDVLSEVGAELIIDSPIQAISGGEMQRVLLARALLREPKLLALDEPAQGVDIGGQQALYALIREIKSRYGCSILMVSHDLNLVMASTDKVYCLNRHICCSGTPDDVSRNPAYQGLFGSKDFAFYSHQHDHMHDIHGGILDTPEQQNEKSDRHAG